MLETAHRLSGAAWGDEGTTQERRAWVADPDIIRRLQVGQACYIHHGAATFVQVARPKPSPLMLAPAPAPVDPAVPVPLPRLEPAPPPVSQPVPPPVPANLDGVFGPGAML